jgi:hypothetical protein
MLVPKCCYNLFEKYVTEIEFYKVDGSHLLLQGKPLVCARIVKKFIEEEKNEK